MARGLWDSVREAVLQCNPSSRRGLAVHRWQLTMRLNSAWGESCGGAAPIASRAAHLHRTAQRVNRQEAPWSLLTGEGGLAAHRTAPRSEPCTCAQASTRQRHFLCSCCAIAFSQGRTVLWSDPESHGSHNKSGLLFGAHRIALKNPSA